jgi:hypothetical protein
LVKTVPPQPTNADTTTSGRRRRRWRVILAIGFAIISGLVAFLIYGPQAIARYVAHTVLTGLDVDVEGVKTLRINLFKGVVTLGPVRFRPIGGDEPLTENVGQLGNLSIDLSLKTLWQRNALIRSAAISGIDIVISREADGQIMINGVPLARILAEEAKDEPPTDQGKSGWGTGVNTLQVRDARLVFRDASRGTMEIAVDWLELEDFRSWEPDQPGTFTLLGQANGMRIIAWGQAEPFADTVRLRVETQIDEISIDKIEAFSGPLPLTRRAGTARLALRSRATLFAAGELDVATIGTVDLIDADLAGDGWRFATKSGRLDLDLTFDGETYASGQVTGTVDLALASVAGGSGESIGVDAQAVRLSLKPITVALAADGSLKGDTSVATAVQAFAVTAPDGLATNTKTLDVEAQSLSFAFEANGSGRVGGLLTTTLKETRADLGDAGALSIAQVTTQLANIAIDLTADGGVKGALTPTARIDGVALTGRRDGLAATVAAFELAAPPLKLTIGGDGAAAVTLAPSAAVRGIAVKGPAAIDVASAELALDPLAVEAGRKTIVRTAGRLAVKSANVNEPALKASLADATIALANMIMETADKQTRLSGEIRSSFGAPQLAMPAAATRGRPSPSEEIRFAARALALDAVPLTAVLKPDQLAVSGKAALRVDDSQLRLPAAAGGPAEVSLNRLALGLDGAKAEMGNAAANVAADLKLELAGATSQLGMVHRDARASVDKVTVTLAPLALRQDARSWEARTKGRVALDKLAATLPKTDLGPVDGTLGGLAVTFADAKAEGRSESVTWRLAADVALRDLTGKLAAGKGADVRVERLSIDDLSGDDRLRFAANSARLGQVRAKLTRAKPVPGAEGRAGAEAAERRRQETGPRGEQAPDPSLRLRQFRLQAPAQIQATDLSVNPPLRAAIAVERLDVDNLNTADVTAKTDIEVAATINEFGRISASGWVSPFADPPDFDLRADVRDLQLPPFSGFAAQAVGVNIDSGRLRSDLKGSASAGQLAAQVDVTVSQLSFGALSSQQAEQASAAIGVPIETAVGLLKDNNGDITLSLPISGDLKAPAFDLSGVIAKAVAGAVTAAVTAPFKLAFAPVSLLADAVGGSAAPGLSPIHFAAGSAVLDAQGEGMVRGLVQVLDERKGLALKVCGRATSADLAQLAMQVPDRAKLNADQILELATREAERLAAERTLAVRRAFSAAGVPASRVGECRAAFDPADAGIPRVEVTL